MQITIESTSKTVTLDGVPARIWEGTTERGTRVVAFVTRLTPMDDDPAEFERDLERVRPPSADVQAFIPSRLIL